MAAAMSVMALSQAQQGHGQVSPEASAKMVKPAEGLQATLWAAEPLVINPTTIDIDSRGRVWVDHCHAPTRMKV